MDCDQTAVEPVTIDRASIVMKPSTRNKGRGLTQQNREAVMVQTEYRTSFRVVVKLVAY
jgi:hypothetical protein